MQDKTAWLVEIEGPFWWSGGYRHDKPDWTNNADEAVKFADRRSAEITGMFIFNTDAGWMATEHMWMEPVAKNAEVFSRPECCFVYCAHPEECRQECTYRPGSPQSQ